MRAAIFPSLARSRFEAAGPLANWILCWLLLPNVSFWLLWIIGGPPRVFQVLVTGTVGLAVHRAPFAVKFAAFVAALVVSVLTYISGIFNLDPTSLMAAIRFASELHPTASPEYLVAALTLVAMTAGAWYALRRPTTLADPRSLLIAFALVLLAAGAEYGVAPSNRGSYKRFAEPGAPFTSAVGQSGFESAASDRRHLLVVMSEAMGAPADPALRRKLIDIWARPEVRRLYEVTSGDTLYYGSTTNGEMRELCGRWGDYPEVLEKADAGCLPARLAARGYHTQAWHSFEGSFFERTRWYPHIGFAEMRFGDRLLADGAAECPGVFPGACDRDVPAQISETLRHARTPQFLYWLTVNTHLPVARDAQLGTADCARFDAALEADNPMACRIFELFDRTGQALAREITRSDFPTADILIMGDHIPPFFNRHQREQFLPDRVPWIRLHRKAPPTERPL
ncbi:MAG TPA: sulfatase-like hydrolase/transferase [Sphingomonas sp.]|nr:sulfatase-like hydrolase/transferase [Sphingomonas sp.]